MTCGFTLLLFGVGLGLIVNETDTAPPHFELYNHMTAQFGVQSKESSYQRSALIVSIKPDTGCKNIENKDELNGKIVLVKRGTCRYIDKALNIAKFGGIGMVVGSDQNDDTLVWMSKPAESQDVDIPCVFVTKSTYDAAVSAITKDADGTVIATISVDGDIPYPHLWSFPSLMQVITYLLILFPCVWALLTIRHFCRHDRRRERRNRQVSNRDIPEILFTRKLVNPDLGVEEGRNQRKETRLTNTSCPICLDNFEEQIKIKLLPCKHGFHSECIGPWISDHSDSCPICRETVLDKLEHKKCQATCCCCNWQASGNDELRQPLIESDAEENGLDIEAPILENPNLDEQLQEPIESENMNFCIFQEPVQVDPQLKSFPALGGEEDQPNLTGENCLDLSQTTPTESQHQGK